MREWKIAWTQRTADKGDGAFVDEYEAESAVDAIALWMKKSYCNARIDAVWDAEFEPLAYKTPQAALDAVMANPKLSLVVSRETPLSPDAPRMERPGASTVRRMKNWERFADWSEATKAFEAECDGAIMKCNWDGIGDWMYMDYIEGESRLDFLKRCKHLTAAGRKEIANLEKAAKAVKG